MPMVPSPTTRTVLAAIARSRSYPVRSASELAHFPLPSSRRSGRLHGRGLALRASMMAPSRGSAAGSTTAASTSGESQGFKGSRHAAEKAQTAGAEFHEPPGDLRDRRRCTGHEFDAERIAPPRMIEDQGAKLAYALGRAWFAQSTIASGAPPKRSRTALASADGAARPS